MLAHRGDARGMTLAAFEPLRPAPEGSISRTTMSLPSTHRRSGHPPAHLRHHLASGCGQDDVDREAAAVRRRDPARGRSQGQGQPAPDAVRLDGHRARARHLGRHVGDDLRTCGLRLQPARHAGPRGLLGRHVPHPVGGGLGRDGDRRRPRHREPDPQALRGLPAARHPDRHLRQQDGSGNPRSLRSPRRDREGAGPRYRTRDLADRPGPRLRGHLRPRPHHGAQARLRRRSSDAAGRGSPRSR